MIDDLISRQAAIGIVQQVRIETMDYGTPSLRKIEEEIETIPSVQPTPCDVCRHNPPSSMDGKPCSYCPAEPCAERRIDEKKNV